MSNGLCCLLLLLSVVVHRYVVGSGAVVHRSNSCVTLHTVEAAWPRTRMPHARGVAPVRRDLPETRRPESHQGRRRSRFPYRRRPCCRLQQPCSSTPRATVPVLISTHRRQHSGFDVAPQCDQQLPRQGDDGDPPCAPHQGANALAKPTASALPGW